MFSRTWGHAEFTGAHTHTFSTQHEHAGGPLGLAVCMYISLCFAPERIHQQPIRHERTGGRLTACRSLLPWWAGRGPPMPSCLLQLVGKWMARQGIVVNSTLQRDRGRSMLLRAQALAVTARSPCINSCSLHGQVERQATAEPVLDRQFVECSPGMHVMELQAARKKGRRGNEGSKSQCTTWQARAWHHSIASRPSCRSQACCHAGCPGTLHRCGRALGSGPCGNSSSSSSRSTSQPD